VKTQGFVGGF